MDEPASDDAPHPPVQEQEQEQEQQVAPQATPDPAQHMSELETKPQSLDDNASNPISTSSDAIEGGPAVKTQEAAPPAVTQADADPTASAATSTFVKKTVADDHISAESKPNEQGQPDLPPKEPKLTQLPNPKFVSPLSYLRPATARSTMAPPPQPTLVEETQIDKDQRQGLVRYSPTHGRSDRN